MSSIEDRTFLFQKTWNHFASDGGRFSYSCETTAYPRGLVARRRLHRQRRFSVSTDEAPAGVASQRFSASALQRRRTWAAPEPHLGASPPEGLLQGGTPAWGPTPAVANSGPQSLAAIEGARSRTAALLFPHQHRRTQRQL
ncbi:hypothetical protein PCL_09753 [Purpureocillium lilacinum]|uniref:Uncharacterized protein n=1 Tax=Purpureocillium lilacinum TaxID=33203 RepID=A0A2U3EDZ6_PURLI|nr:hypothetical protein Purlil1_1222 [Purpureocillium lilacinum]PWI72738.1 hypothetical protein PCL_09753 [Purpureocillium lilacinum]